MDKPLLPWLLFAAVASTATAALAADRKAELQEKRGEISSRIESLQKDLAKKEETRSDAAEQLREIESAISIANRKLRELGDDRRRLQGELAGLEAQVARLDRQTATQQSQLGRLLHHQFVGGDSDALRLMLSGQDPNQAARDRYFLTQLSRAKADLIVELRGVAAEKKRLAEGVRERQEKLADIERREQEGRAQLVDKQKQRQALMARLGSQIKAQRAEIGALKRDEQRLSSLLASLAKASRPKAPKVDAGRTADAGRRSEKLPAGKPVRDADPGAVGDFGALRGKLRLPVAGTVAARFGAPRAEGGTAWRGILIRAAEGEEVKAVAAGTVVFADWLRGFGNLLVIDHGDDFLSVYGNNQSLLRNPGQPVKGGETVATVGSSGGGTEAGLYFELRHRGQPFDPLKWARR